MSKVKQATLKVDGTPTQNEQFAAEAGEAVSRRSRKTQEKRRTILVAAAKVFKEKGYFEASLADIGREAGTFAGSLYYHFDSKNAIADEVLTYGTTGITELVKSSINLPEGTSYRERLRQALTCHFTQMMLKDDFIVAYWKLIEQVPTDIRERHLHKAHQYAELWEELVRGAIAANEIRPNVNPAIFRMLIVGGTIWGMDWFQWGLNWQKSQNHLTPREISDEIISIVFDGAVTRMASLDASC